MSKALGGFLAVTGFLACPCHFPLTLPLLLGVLAGTGVGSFIGGHTGLTYGLASGYFVVGIGAGIYLWNRKAKGTQQASCDVHAQPAQRGKHGSPGSKQG